MQIFFREDLIGKYATIVGWGYTNYDSKDRTKQGDFNIFGVASRSQQKLDMPILSANECSSKFQAAITPARTQLCAGGIQGKDSCKVPLLIHNSIRTIFLHDSFRVILEDHC